jgi:hypothetical protein
MHHSWAYRCYDLQGSVVEDGVDPSPLVQSHHNHAYIEAFEQSTLGEELLESFPLLLGYPGIWIQLLCDFLFVDHCGFHLEKFGLNQDIVPRKSSDSV